MCPTGGRNVRNNGVSSRISLSDQLYHTIRKKIITWQIPPNEIIVEARLAEENHVSKTPVREALGLLSQDGLVEVIPRVGYRVCLVSVQDVHEVFELRIFLEGEAAALAAQRATEKELLMLQELDHAGAKELRGDESDPEDYLHFHDMFHLQIAKLSGNSRLAGFIAKLLRDGTRLRMRDPLMSSRGLAEEQEDSVKIVEALISRDAEKARKLMQEHIVESKERVLMQIMHQGAGPEVQVD